MVARSLLPALALALSLALALACPFLPARAAGAPNVVLILLDDVGYGDLGAYGGSFVATPVLDSLASEGMRFTQYHANAATCNPSRVAIMTGLYPIHLGARAPVGADSDRGLLPGVESLADRMRSAGYATGHFGKWHLGSRPEYLPARHGFDHSMIPVTANGPYLGRQISIDGGEPVVAPGHMTEVTTDHALAFIAENASRPFFLNLWYNAAHVPYEPPERWAERYPVSDVGRYAATLSHADEQIGRVLDALKSLGLESRTLVLVTSDNGGTHDEIASNGNLQGGKAQVFEGGLRLPLLARWPGRVAAGSTNDSLYLGLDFLPTLAELAGVPVGSGLPGRSLLPALLEGAAPAREEPIGWEIADRPIPATPDLSPLAYAMRRGPWKLVHSQATGADRSVLYDLASDEGETTDLAPEHPELVAQLETDYRVWRAREARIETRIAQSSEVSVAGSWIRFWGGSVDLAPDPRFVLDDGDFGFRVRVTPADLDSEQMIASQSGSWALSFGPDGSVELGVPREDGSRVRLASPPRLQPGVATDVAFSVFGMRELIDLRLFVDGALEASARVPGSMLPSSAAVRLGNGLLGARPFRGTLDSPRFFLASLAEEDLRDVDFDGVPNALDDCIEVPNGAARPEPGGAVQRDEDGDGIGTACDPDFDGDGSVGLSDVLALFARFGRHVAAGDPAARFDLDASGGVGFFDIGVLADQLGGPPGPSSLICTASAPCLDPTP